jgi:ligand-binding SRPBCC domain-containing protein
VNRKYNLPPTFQISFKKLDSHAYLLKASQVLAVPLEKAFSFFEKPENLFDITPDWLDFKLDKATVRGKTYEGAEFDYTIRWLKIPIRWHAKILEYRPPELFADVQVRGPYKLWRHLHTFEAVPDGTLMRDSITYRIPFGFISEILHKFIILKQLRDIFSYRAVRIAEWADGNMKGKRTDTNIINS